MPKGIKIPISKEELNNITKKYKPTKEIPTSPFRHLAMTNFLKPTTLRGLTPRARPQFQ